MKHMCVRLLTVAFCALFAVASVWAQGASTAGISGVVVDADGGVVPGADIVLKNNGTGETFNAVSNERGLFSFPAMITGTYTVTVSLQGFKTVVLNNVVVNAGVPASVRASLEVGGLTEQVVVQARSELVQTTTATVATTLDTRQVASLPLSSRNAADFIVFLPGVTTPGGSRDSIVNGLPQTTINMTLDGVNIQDNTNKSTDGFFAIVGPRIDAVEEITVSMAATGAEGTGGGATQIRYTTKSGTNDFRGSFFHQYRSDELNANTWFNKRDNLPKGELLQNQPGVNFGGPILRNKAFFFVNYEELRQPSTTRRNRRILHPEAQAGVFRYSAGGGVQTVNLFELAARNGQTVTPDPIITRLLADIRAATQTEGNIRDLTDPLFQEYAFQIPGKSHNNYPTVRMDYQVNDKHRLTYSLNYQYFCCGPDTTNNREVYFPGFPISSNQDSVRRATSGWLRSILSPTMVNEFRIGYGGAPVIFSQQELRPEMWNGPVANQGGFHLDISRAVGITNAGGGFNAGNAGTTSARDAYHTSFENTLNWQKGPHSFNFGGSFTTYDIWLQNQQIVPELRFGIVQGDPADAMFTGANFPGASNAAINNARGLYAILTGRVSEVRYIARLNERGEYEILSQGEQLARQRQMGFWAQDAWRMGPNLTMNFGVRYDLTFPFISRNSSYTVGNIEDVYGASGVGNIFKPGTLTGKYPEFHQLAEGERAYPMDWNNIAPSLGFAWTPSAASGFLRRLTGNNTGDLSVRAGFSRSYTRLGLGDFTGEIGDNPGVSINAFRSQALGNLGPLPLLFRDTSRLGPGAFPRTPTFPLRDAVTEDITIFSPDLVVPFSDTWQAGVTRAIGRSMSIEARYLGARSKDNWRTTDHNELNIIENGFLDEFRLAMANLQANNAAGGTRAGSFAYYGPGTGTVPLPIFLAYFGGFNRAQAGDASLYTSGNFRSSTFVTPLARFNPNPYGAADALDADAAARTRAITAGLPANFLVANPDLLGGANVVMNSDRTMYNSFALEFKRRTARNLTFTGSYIFGHATNSRFLSLRVDSPMVRNDGAEGDVTHAFKLNAVYPLPFGREQKFGSGVNGLVDRIIGGWQIAGNARVQSGRLLDLGNVRLVGMSKDELRKAFKLRIDAQNRVFMWPQDIIDETFKAFSVSATSTTGYGTLGPPSGRYIAPADSFDCIETIRGEGRCGVQSLTVTGPLFKQIDISLVKRVDIVGRINAEIRIDALNVFDHANFAPVTGLTAATNRISGSTQADYEVSGLTGVNTARVLQLVSRIRW